MLGGFALIFVPILQEIYFRGVLFIKLKKNIGLYSSSILQAIFFSLIHFQFLDKPYILIVFLFGILMSIFYIKTKSLIGPILCHITFNYISFLEAYQMNL